MIHNWSDLVAESHQFKHNFVTVADHSRARITTFEVHNAVKLLLAAGVLTDSSVGAEKMIEQTQTAMLQFLPEIWVCFIANLVSSNCSSFSRSRAQSYR